MDRENKVGETPLIIVCGGIGGDSNNGTSFEAAQMLAKRGADVLAHSSLLNKAFGDASKLKRHFLMTLPRICYKSECLKFNHPHSLLRLPHHLHPQLQLLQQQLKKSQ